MLNELPLYRDTFELVSLIYVNDIPKKYKFSIGDKLLTTTLNLFDSLVKANINHKDKEKLQYYMDEYLNTYLLVRTLTRLCAEKKLFTLNLTANLALIFEPIEKSLHLKRD